ncbi:hypothetical protein MLD38_007009 [Melastoma candidum]|uniref:Uncharacterized protein n=1 Tax=Melastoma candidum TaxID=119954 RepID=A0ACB9RQ93_9MYRT|nr:hypothetical protein MLD38_007009 [Melastoma candidum]
MWHGIKYPCPYWKILYPEDMRTATMIKHELWPLDGIDTKKEKFPCCLVWTPLPVISWLAPFIGHVGIRREDGVILDFSGSNLVNVDNFSFGSVARYLQLDRQEVTQGCSKHSFSQKSFHLTTKLGPCQCCFPPNLSGHMCKPGYKHSEFGTALTWDKALQSTGRTFEHKTYNLFTCNCHSFVANCLNRLCFHVAMDWNMINVAELVLLKGQWGNKMSVVRSFLPFMYVLSLGRTLAGWSFIIGLLSFSMLIVGWFLLGTFCFISLIEC